MRWQASERTISEPLDKFEPVPPWIANEKSLLPWKSISRDYLDARCLEPRAHRFEIRNPKGRMPPRRFVHRRRILLGRKMELLHAALVPCARTPAVGVGGTLERFEAEQLLVKCARLHQRVVAGVDEQIYMIESDYEAHQSLGGRMMMVIVAFAKVPRFSCAYYADRQALGKPNFHDAANTPITPLATIVNLIVPYAYDAKTTHSLSRTIALSSK